MQDLDNHEVRVEMTEGKTSFQMVLPMSPLLSEVAGAIEQTAAQAGLLMMKALIDEEVEQIAGRRYGHQADRQPTRWGRDEGHVIFCGRKVALPRPRVRSVEGRDHPFGAGDILLDEPTADRIGVRSLEGGQLNAPCTRLIRHGMDRFDTPTTVRQALFRQSVLPTTSGHAVKRRRRSPSLMTATGYAPGVLSSCGSKTRPRCGLTPSSRKYSADTNSAPIRSGSPSWGRVSTSSAQAATGHLPRRCGSW